MEFWRRVVHGGRRWGEREEERRGREERGRGGEGGERGGVEKGVERRRGRNSVE